MRGSPTSVMARSKAPSQAAGVRHGHLPSRLGQRLSTAWSPKDFRSPVARIASGGLAGRDGRGTFTGSCCTPDAGSRSGRVVQVVNPLNAVSGGLGLQLHPEAQRPGLNPVPVFPGPQCVLDLDSETS